MPTIDNDVPEAKLNVARARMETEATEAAERSRLATRQAELLRLEYQYRELNAKHPDEDSYGRFIDETTRGIAGLRAQERALNEYDKRIMREHQSTRRSPEQDAKDDRAWAAHVDRVRAQRGFEPDLEL